MATRKSLSIYGCFWLLLSGGVILVRYWLSGAYQIFSPITAPMMGYSLTVLMSGNRELAFHLSRGGRFRHLYRGVATPHSFCKGCGLFLMMRFFVFGGGGVKQGFS